VSALGSMHPSIFTIRPLASTTSTIADRRPRIVDDADGGDDIAELARGSHDGAGDDVRVWAPTCTGTNEGASAALIGIPGQLALTRMPQPRIALRAAHPMPISDGLESWCPAQAPPT
jgi:hypothetical protein